MAPLRYYLSYFPQTTDELTTLRATEAEVLSQLAQLATLSALKGAGEGDNIDFNKQQQQGQDGDVDAKTISTSTMEGRKGSLHNSRKGEEQDSLPSVHGSVGDDVEDVVTMLPDDAEEEDDDAQQQGRGDSLLSNHHHRRMQLSGAHNRSGQTLLLGNDWSGGVPSEDDEDFVSLHGE